MYSAKNINLRLILAELLRVAHKSLLGRINRAIVYAHEVLWCTFARGPSKDSTKLIKYLF